MAIQVRGPPTRPRAAPVTGHDRLCGGWACIQHLGPASVLFARAHVWGPFAFRPDPRGRLSSAVVLHRSRPRSLSLQIAHDVP